MRYLLLLFISLLFSACSSAIRFTSNNNAKKFKSGNKEINTTQNIKSYSEYSNYKPLKTVQGIASYYAHKYNRKRTSDGEIFDMYKMTAAHHSFPFNTIVRVTNLNNNESVIVRINDRLPAYNHRIIDLSYGAAKKIGMLISGIAKVRLEVLKWGNSK